MATDYFRPRPQSTVFSTTSYDSSDRPLSTGSTPLTSPSLFTPPKKHESTFQPIAEIYEVSHPTLKSTQMDARDAPKESSASHCEAEVTRGPSVRDRASRYEQALGSGSKAGPSASSRTRSTSPLRGGRVTSCTTTPNHIRRIPVPSTEPASRVHGESRGDYGREEGGDLKRGTGTARRMIQQWESGAPTSLASTPRRPVFKDSPSRSKDREYLDHKPLPLPCANAIPATSYSPTSGFPHRPSPARKTTMPYPLNHLQTPTQPLRARSNSLTPSPSSYSLNPSPSSDKKRSGRSPLKEILGVFGGGIKEMGRKAKGRGKEKVNDRGGRMFVSLDGDDDPWLARPQIGTNGLPGGIVFSDRMGDQEMDGRNHDDKDWGSWLTSWATLTPTTLRITYCPIFQTGHSTPKRVMSGVLSGTPTGPPTPYAFIPCPDPSMSPDVEMSMKDCVEVRSLRRDEVKGRGVPPVPEGVGTEVLEIVFLDGSKRYIGVEGVSGRLGWVSAIWDVLLACKSTQQNLTLPPPSPMASIGLNSRIMPPAMTQEPQKTGEMLRADLAEYRINSPNNETRSGTPLNNAPPVQKVGDTWVAASVLGTSDLGPAQGQPEGVKALRDSVQRMFESGPDVPMFNRLEPTRRKSAGTAVTERVLAWQPTPADMEGRTVVGGMGIDENMPLVDMKKSETLLSFDPNDLNPSRSASQVRRSDTIIERDEECRRFGNGKGTSGGTLRAVLPAVAEGGSDDGSAMGRGPPTQISHVTFPKPTIGGQRISGAVGTAQRQGVSTLSTIPSSSESSCESEVRTGESTLIRTPALTEPSSVMSDRSSIDPTVIAKLDSHTTEHGSLSKQIDNVQVDLNRVALSLNDLLLQQRAKVIDPSPGADPLQLLPTLDEKLTTVALDVKAVENALQLSNLAASRQAQVSSNEGQILEVNSKLDSIVKLCEEVLAATRAQAVEVAAGVSAQGIESNSVIPPVSKAGESKLVLPVENAEEKQAGEEVAHIMAELTGGSSKSPRLGGIQVLHTAPASPVPASSPKSSITTGDAPGQVAEILGLVKELQGARTLQTQQTSDIARYLNELNSWLEKFVQNSGTELGAMSKRINQLVGEDPPEGDEGSFRGGRPSGGLITDLHAMVSEQKRRHDAEGPVGQRLDALLLMMIEDKERQNSHQNLVEQVITIVEKQRHDNQLLLGALAKDLTSEIRGERLRFIEAMQAATSVNVQSHVEEFKKLLSTEVHKAMHELGRVREEKKALQQEISDLFALKAKHGASSGENSRRGSANPPRALPTPHQTLH